MPVGDPTKAEDHGYSFIMQFLSCCNELQPDYDKLAKMIGYGGKQSHYMA
jgi:hypothetical protein